MATVKMQAIHNNGKKSPMRLVEFTTEEAVLKNWAWFREFGKNQFARIEFRFLQENGTWKRRYIKF